MAKTFPRTARKLLTLGVVLAASTSLTGCLDDDDSSSGGGGGGANCAGGAAAFFTRYADTYTLPADFTGVGTNSAASPTTAGVFTETSNYDIIVGSDQTITFITDGSDIVFDYTDSANELAICERGVIDGRTYEEYVRIDTADYVILFQAFEGADEILGTADDGYQASFTILNVEDTGNIFTDASDDEYWNFN